MVYTNLYTKGVPPTEGDKMIRCEFCEATLDEDVLGSERFDELFDEWTVSEVRLGDGTVDDVFRWCPECEADMAEHEQRQWDEDNKRLAWLYEDLRDTDDALKEEA